MIENDDRTFGLRDVLELHRRTGLRVVWDILHHHCHDPDGIPDREALELALSTWPGLALLRLREQLEREMAKPHRT